MKRNRVFPSSRKREISHFQDVAVQWRLTNVQKNVMYVQSCFANLACCIFAVSVAVTVVVKLHFKIFDAVLKISVWTGH